MAVLSSILLLGSILLSYAENGYALASPAAGTPTITTVSLLAMASVMPQSEIITPPSRSTDTPTSTPNSECPLKEGFKKYIVQSGDTLSDLAHKNATSWQIILNASCIEAAGSSSVSLEPGSVLHIPIVHPTGGEGYCPAPYGWILYKVKPGETLFDLSLETHVDIADLQEANCLGNSTKIIAWQPLYLPFIPYSPPIYATVFPPTVTPSATASRTPFTPPSWTPAAPATNTGNASSATPSSSPDASATNNPSPTSSDTPVFQPPTSTPIPPDTDTPVPPPTDTPLPPPTDTPVPPPSDTPVPPPSDTPLIEPKEITPIPPEPTEGIGLSLCPSFITLLKV